MTLFLGNYGSGKTEVAVNFALKLASEAEVGEVALADLDLVNPYFRSREPQRELEAAGVRVVVPEGRYHHADLPILLPEVRSLLEASTARVVLDVGGDDVGARVLGSLHDSLPEGSYEALMVVNGNRPFTGTAAGIARIRQEIESAGRVRVTGLVSNTHLMGETDLATILGGYRLAREAAEAGGLAVRFVCAPPELVAGVAEEVTVPVLELRRYLATSWQRGRPAGDGLVARPLFRP